MKTRMSFILQTSLVVFICCAPFVNAQEQRDLLEIEEAWADSEYSGVRTEKNLRTAFTSKGFAWLSGSPADNEKLSIGKNAQFFGFVALRSESGRAANRGILGRAFYAISSDEQRALLEQAVYSESDSLSQWWETRARILRLYETHLYTGELIVSALAEELGAKFGRLGASVAIFEAKAFAALEDSLTDVQIAEIRRWRANPELAQEYSDTRVSVVGMEREERKQLEDLFAKSFSWITGTAEDNEIIPLGQPAQFFGFVSIRHKSGHGANRGDIAKSFLKILDQEQETHITNGIEFQTPVVEQFLQRRHEFLEELELLRSQPKKFNYDRAMELASAMGLLEAKAGLIEATTYRHIRKSMSEVQITQMMALRSNYILDEFQVETLTFEQRGSQLAILCAGCHGVYGEHQSGRIGPSLDHLFERPIASDSDFSYSDAMLEIGDGRAWTSSMLDEFLADPELYLPGTKMEFQGLLKSEDRQALIAYLQGVTP